MKTFVSHEPIEGVAIEDMKSFQDKRGSLEKVFYQQISQRFDFTPLEFFITKSHYNVFRGMHFQAGEHPADKIIFVLKGTISDFLLDLRSDSKTFGCINNIELDENNNQFIYIPAGVAHGYLTLTQENVVGYLMNQSFCNECDGGVNSKLVSKHFHQIDNAICSDKDSALPESIILLPEGGRK